MHRGYVKLWRKALDSGYLKNPNLWAFMSYCLVKATHKPSKVVVGWETVSLEPGQFVFGQHRAAEELATSRQIVRQCLDTLKSADFITITTTNKYSVISVVNWSTYQSDNVDNNQQSNPQPIPVATSQQPANNHIQECKEQKEGSRKNPPPLKERHLRFVLLLPEETEKLRARLNGSFAEMVERLDGYIGQIGEKKAAARYKSHYDVILNWWRKDHPDDKAHDAPKTEADDFFAKVKGIV